jgi:nitrogen-specific signal transduction histidine kinase
MLPMINTRQQGTGEGLPIHQIIKNPDAKNARKTAKKIFLYRNVSPVRL